MRWIVPLLFALAAADSAIARPVVGGPPDNGNALDVPYLPQTEALCGGAAAAMVFRFWGRQHADVQQFASLVDVKAGGIAAAALTQAIEQRGFHTAILDGSIETIRAELAAGHPLILLLATRPNLYHYVVAVGADATHVWLHDPTWGPSRPYRTEELIQLWKPANFWTLRILPPAGGAATVEATAGQARAAVALGVPETACSLALAKAVDEIQAQGFGVADARLGDVRATCPDRSEPISELAGVRFAEQRFDEAAALAEEATARNVDDRYAWDVLGSSRFVRNDPNGALQAWNRLEKPILDSVRIQGLRRTRYALITELLDLPPNTLLEQESYARARRRLEQLPDQLTSRIGFRPGDDGFAVVEIAVVERPRLPSGAIGWAAAVTRALTNEEVEAAVPGWSGQGEVWTASWRWWERRPRIGLGFSTPRTGRFPGVWRVEGFQDRQTYAGATAGSSVRETQTHAGVGVSNWLTSRLRYGLSAGADSWSPGQKAFSLGASLERRWLADRLAVSGGFSRWMAWPGSSGATANGFHVASFQTSLRSSTIARGFVHLADARVEAASASSPLSLWVGAGGGQARPTLLRAHPLTDAGVIDGPAFGRRMVALNLESQRWFARPAMVRLGVAAFADLVRTGQRLPDAVGKPFQVDTGVGLRVRAPGQDGFLRVDYARGLRDGRHTLTVGWSSN